MSMPHVVFKLDLFNTPGDRGRSQKALLWLMEALVQINLTWLASKKFPSLYNSSVVYRFEENEVDYWMDIPTMMKLGYGDCEDLACWRVAELRSAGINARPYIKWRRKEASANYIYHAVVWWPDRRIEDPSLALGMRGGILRKPVFIDRDDEDYER